MDLKRKIEVFSELGDMLSRIGAEGDLDLLSKKGYDRDAFEQSLNRAMDDNAWFTSESIFRSLYILGVSMNNEDLEKWTGMYDLKEDKGKTVAVIMAGNIPAVGFHDFMSVLMSGNKVLAKLSSDDSHLIPAIADLIIAMEPDFAEMIAFTEGTIKDFDAVIATGSNNTSRYFKHYFGKYPHIIRKNRNGLGVISGNEDQESLRSFGDDIFMYYGLGCRNISKLFIPHDYDLKTFYDPIENYASVANHHKYKNNYDYNKSIYLVNSDPHYDNGFLLLKESASMASPVSVLHFERYDDTDEVNRFIAEESENIQCVISDDPGINTAIPPGTAQYPKLWDYADGVDTMEFLSKI